MIGKILLKLVLKGDENYKDEKTRSKVGILSGVIGVLANVLLTIIKIYLGILTHSIAVSADAFNNLTDAGSSLITLIGFKFASTPADREHPYGHGRIEYIASFLVSAMVLVVGFNFVKSSIDRIINPEEVVFSWGVFIMLSISIVIKIALVSINRSYGKLIESKGLIAVATDAWWDIVISAVVLTSLIASLFTSIPFDGYIGLIIALMIIRSGYSLTKETVSQLIGEAPDSRLVNKIRKEALSEDFILGVHDIFMDNYGPKKIIATMDVEVSADMSLIECHKRLNILEKKIADLYGIKVITHVEPIGKYSETELEIKNLIADFVKDKKEIKSFHDILIYHVSNREYVDLQLVIDGCLISDEFDKEELKRDAEYLITKKRAGINPRVEIFIDYVDYKE